MSMSIFCPKCGKEISEKSVFCLYCGANVSEFRTEPESTAHEPDPINIKPAETVQEQPEVVQTQKTANTNESQKRKTNAAVLIFLAAFALFIVVSAIKSSSKRYSADSSQSGTSSTSRRSSSSNRSAEIESAVYVLAKKCVESHLKAPSTAEFCSMSDCEFREGEDGVYMMAGTVDSQSTYGAMLRETWSIMAQLDGEKVTLVLLQIGDQTYFE